MTKNILVTRPQHEMRVSYLHEFAKGPITLAKMIPGVHVTDLEGPKATRMNVEKSLKREQPKLVFLNGHGDRKSVCGHNDETILDKENILLTKNKIVYALACESLEVLGEKAVENGTIAYIGYKAKFMVVRDTTRTPS
ncbi:MAG: hypothetical protein Q8R18_02170 [bacterium]|nr:hypothetical protein [bacterium]